MIRIHDFTPNPQSIQHYGKHANPSAMVRVLIQAQEIAL